MKAIILSGLFVLAGVSVASAQLPRVTMGHHHLMASDVEAAKRFWITLGATTVPFGNAEAIKMPNLIILLRGQAPSGGTIGTTVNHIGVQVPDVRAAVEKLRAAGYPIVTERELPPGREVINGVATIADQNTYAAFVMAPDEVKVELFENKNIDVQLANHHIHFYTDQVDQMKAWYVRTFDAIGGMRGAFQAADLPGVNLTFTPVPTATEGTRGRSLDHIGFEVKNLEEFSQRLASMGITFEQPFRRVRPDLAIAFFFDPWGTYIELTEGLDTL